MGARAMHGGPLFNLSHLVMGGWSPRMVVPPLFPQDPWSLSLTLLGDPDQAKESRLPINPFVGVIGVLAGGCRAEGGLWPHRDPSLEGGTSTCCCSPLWF